MGFFTIRSSLDKASQMAILSFIDITLIKLAFSHNFIREISVNHFKVKYYYKYFVSVQIITGWIIEGLL